MSRKERNKLRAEVDAFGDGQGGLLDANIAKILARSILLLDESNEMSFKVNSALTVVLLLVGLLQVWLMTGCTDKPAQRFVARGADGDTTIMLDTKTGLVCAGNLGFNEPRASFGKTPIIAANRSSFIPFCADIYLNERRVMKDFDSYMHQPQK
jgi:hypothetical protein